VFGAVVLFDIWETASIYRTGQCGHNGAVLSHCRVCNNEYSLPICSGGKFCDILCISRRNDTFIIVVTVTLLV
jgi:hypothetical protein